MTQIRETPPRGMAGLKDYVCSTANSPENSFSPHLPQVRILAFKPFEKNTLRGFFDLELPSGMILSGCTLHEKDDKYWVGLPGKPYTAADGSQAWTRIIDFRDAKTRNKFQESITPLARVAYEHHAGQADD
jgi:hypothetical protein